MKADLYWSASLTPSSLLQTGVDGPCPGVSLAEIEAFLEATSDHEAGATSVVVGLPGVQDHLAGSADHV